ncbi:DUF6194 family protein [Cellulomonas endophytica]|uniref:DUF6194 family protein n=1 Tax=Cellulomonas endophytica TaxID=2494735 RepID=UPI001011A343|nr:DUF6194 family protein [Cellulomonas endophytica]
MDLDDVIALVSGWDGVRTWRPGPGDGSPEIARGDVFFLDDPHPVHAGAGWLAVVCPGPAGDAETCELLERSCRSARARGAAPGRRHGPPGVLGGRGRRRRRGVSGVSGAAG